MAAHRLRLAQDLRRPVPAPQTRESRIKLMFLTLTGQPRDKTDPDATAMAGTLQGLSLYGHEQENRKMAQTHAGRARRGDALTLPGNLRSSLYDERLCL